MNDSKRDGTAEPGRRTALLIFKPSVRAPGRLAAGLTRLRRLSPIRKAVGAAAAFILLILSVTTTLAFRRYNAELADAARELRTLDLLLAEETGRSLQSVDLVLDSIVGQMIGEKVDTPEALADRGSKRDVNDALRTRVAGIPQLDAVSIVGADGNLINFSRFWPVPAIQLQDREYFQYLRTHVSEAAYLSEPVLNRGTGTPTIYLAKRLSGPDGRFLGVILGAIELSYFERLYLSLHLEPGNFIALWRQDGLLLARYPAAQVGQRMPQAAIVPNGAAWHGVQGVSEKDWSLDGEAAAIRIVASQPVSDFPLRINIGRRKAVILKDWRRELLATGTFVLIAILCILALTWALIRRFKAYEAVAAAGRERERAIVARQEAEEALRQSQKMEAIGQLTGGVAHDFNNLLTVIGSSVELLRRDSVSPERRVRYVEAIADAAGRAAKLTAQLLAFARKQDLKPEVFDAVGNIATVSQMIDRLTGPLIRVETVLPDEPCFVDADPNQFDTAIVNMAVNARDAMEQGGRLTITVTNLDRLPAMSGLSGPDCPFVAVSVRDTGQGIAPEMRDRVFEPFFTTKKVGQGTGLGLSQVIGFAQQSGGEVSVDSVMGEGSMFTLLLPRATLDRIEARNAKQSYVIPNGRGARILVVDDDQQVGRLASQMLRELRYFAIPTAGAEEALQVLDDDPEGFDAVFSDVVMPGMDGLALARAVRSRFPALPVLLATGFSAALTESGSDGFAVLRKPYTMNELAGALHDAMRDEPNSAGDAPVMPAPAEYMEPRRTG